MRIPLYLDQRQNINKVSAIEIYRSIYVIISRSINQFHNSFSFKTTKTLERDLIGIQPHTNRLTFLASASDFDETLDLPYHLLHRYGHIVIHTQAIDSHIYILKKWIVEFLNGVKMQIHLFWRHDDFDYLLFFSLFLE